MLGNPLIGIARVLVRGKCDFLSSDQWKNPERTYFGIFEYFALASNYFEGLVVNPLLLLDLF